MMNSVYTPSHVNRPSVPAHRPVIKVIGMGGGGCNAINRMIEHGLTGIDFVAANTDHQALTSSLAPIKIHLGPHTTRGLGAGGKPEVGHAAAEESTREIKAALAGADMVFLTAGMGGGTGTGSIGVAARIARETGAVTIAVVTTPFSFEMGRRQKNAAQGLALLRPHTDTLISIPNDRLLYVAPKNLPLEFAFHLADDVLRQGVQGITELITEAGMINVDFSHIRHVMKLGGGALMSIGHGNGDNKALKAIEQALHHPLLETASLDNAKGILVNFTAGNDLTLFEVEEALTILHNQAGSQADILFGVINDPHMVDRVQVILVATGLGSPTLEEALFQVSKPAVREPVAPVIEPEPIVEAKPEIHHTNPVPLTTRPLPSSNNLDLPAFLRRGR